MCIIFIPSINRKLIQRSWLIHSKKYWCSKAQCQLRHSDSRVCNFDSLHHPYTFSIKWPDNNHLRCCGLFGLCCNCTTLLYTIWAWLSVLLEHYKNCLLQIQDRFSKCSVQSSSVMRACWDLSLLQTYWIRICISQGLQEISMCIKVWDPYSGTFSKNFPQSNFAAFAVPQVHESSFWQYVDYLPKDNQK